MYYLYRRWKLSNTRHSRCLLDNRFFKCNRAVIINVEQVKRYNNSKNIAILKNGEEFKDISRNKKKEMAKRVRGIS